MLGENVEIETTEFDSIAKFSLSNQVELILVGPEEPLVNGIADHFKRDERLAKIKIFGPTRKGALLEGSKDFAKQFMLKNNIPTAKFATFNRQSHPTAIDHLVQNKPPYVLKADGLAAGKGVLIAENFERAKDALDSLLIKKKFGEASEKIVIEEYLEGIELSVFIITDGKSYILLPEAKDYKRIGEGDQGLNTGGMGAVSPVTFAKSEFLNKVENEIIKPTLDGLKKAMIPYCGFIFFGLMNCNGQPFLIEYNVRLGDPEAQAVLPRLKSDLLGILLSAIDGNLKDQQLEISQETATTVVMASGGYPEKYEKGKIIEGLHQNENLIFHAGTKKVDENILTSGGRVLAVTGLGKNISEAMETAYGTVDNIHWEHAYYRKDIGKDLLNLGDKV